MSDYSAPKYNDMFEACLKAIKQVGDNASQKAIYEQVIKIMDLPPEVLAIAQKGRSGQSQVYYRIGWTLWNLKLIKCVYQPTRGRFSLSKQVTTIPANAELQRLASEAKKVAQPVARPKQSLQPQLTKNQTGAEKLLAHLKDLGKDGRQLEMIVVALLDAMDEYDSPITTATTNDGGIDIVADRLDEFSEEPERVVIQVKNYTKTKISNKEIRDIRGSSNFSDRCWYITTSDFTDQAKAEAAKTTARKAVKLTNGLELAYLLIENNVGLKHLFPIKE